jgi:hypothetical protein
MGGQKSAGSNREVDMKRNLIVLIALFSLVLGVSAGASAGMGTSYCVLVDIPFDFHVADQRMPAGEYRIEMPLMGSSAIGSMLKLESQDGAFCQFLQTMRIDGNRYDTNCHVVFNKYGDSLFLARVTNSQSGAQAPKSPLEKKLADEYNLAGVEVSSLEVVAVPARVQ